MRLKSPLFLLLFACHIANAQVQESADKLKQLANERKANNLIQKERAEAYAKALHIPMQFTDDKGNHIYLLAIDEFGWPVYTTTLNAGAALTTGVTQFKTGGTLGLNLEGEGMVAGVWDEGLVKDHIEFENRILSRQGNSYSAHSTHVTGTILAKGIQTTAKGMASKAQATTWDFDNDEAEMASLAKPDQSTLLLSNHSYGILMGFYNNGGSWAWAGNPTVSSAEDYRFGFYNDKSRTIDQITYNAPYYTIVWAGGNDRTDSGDGSHPADGNAGTGYDCLGPDGVAKNNITVGAVQKVLNYTGPSSVVMSTFSSWGPTDDGRIKPDLVAAGVSVYSTFISGGADSYSTQQGTSMAAPNVTGSLILLQQLYRDLHGGSFMKAATLKALAIHSAKEAGTDPGPDYRFGWGLLDVEAGAKILLNQATQQAMVLENTLQNSEVYELEFEPLQNTKITATIVWTDPPATPVAPQLDPANLMLVNDLDLRLVDDAGNESFPWILNPLNPAAPAIKADNMRDNVEKMEFDTPGQGKYKIRVSHKGTLVNGKQDFSLILTYTPFANTATTYYWIGNSGNWNDPSNWSLSTGGISANQVPDGNSRVVIDENSFSGSNQTMSLTADATCSSLTWLTKKAAALALENHTLSIDGSFIVASDSFSVSSPGSVELLGVSASQNQLNLNNNNLSQARIVINGANGASWTVNGKANIGEIDLQSGSLIARGTTLKLSKLNANSTVAKTLDITGTTIAGLTESTLSSTNLELTASTTTSIQLADSGPAALTWTGIEYGGTLDTKSSTTTFSGGASIKKIIISGTVDLNDNNLFEEFVANAGSTISIQNSTTQTLTSKTTLNALPSGRISIATAGGNAVLNFDGHYKLCFDYLDVGGVNIEGTATISAGSNSALTNAANWFSGACGNALFSDFTVRYNCAGALTEFSDVSEGNIVSWNWNFGDPSSAENTSAKEYPTHIYSDSNTYTVTLSVSDGVNDAVFSKEITVTNNDIPPNNVLSVNGKLFSEVAADAYQWFWNGEKQVNATGRWYTYNGEDGSYFVVISSAKCNLPSAPFLITGIGMEQPEENVLVFPNPASEEIHIRVGPNELPVNISLVNSLGQLVYEGKLTNGDAILHTDKFRDGLYVIIISSGTTVRKKLIVKKE